ncbi:alpha/beta-hydrolase [Exidia glandulosa HHB12029]|uniref:Alpha/beta-hydrolase n=1 Tax=Exidia glandulosa HHB12029 TaxID=1314781 RepID=A0A165JSG9_EXIGL|nr:alpha/beta-hydrolase [Exidia glandulosa HHB12029]
MTTPAASQLTPGAHAFTTASGATLTYFVLGHGPHVLVNVAPGWGVASVLYQNTFGFLEDPFTFVHLEVRGTRGSSFPAEPEVEMSSWHMSEDVEALRIHLGVDALDGLTGHSNGGCIALWYAIRFPAHLHRLVLLDAQCLGTDDIWVPAMLAILEKHPNRDAVAAFWKWEPQTMTSDEDMLERLSAFMPLYLANAERDLATFQRGLTTVPQYLCVQTQRVAELAHQDEAEQLDKITAKTLVIVGRQDFICPVVVAELIAGKVKNSTLKVVEDCGHLPWIEQKDEFAAILKDFYAQ